ncbi:uncharacterized protein LOC125437674 [Sphaerodactylus townsendi]|uniref:uncharacterized protein LOC125437674 n=1 Tax=Sphaerodactylus townsendi TaxID=933632 RepID=UPI002026E0D6|nr:uncharacterized protein LOC125437674 [Sphaerodactylus townsendi]XP_048361464.1 uncharacterized protein LOC125437674 [Sphaerodactylus townsendi]XP_048361465.1 uncharacterized protein LOC125437674 [Sphaerodactylus townsendi]XP_048361466.1 uncharacterized protein LOC125437674 [Sphaerodactylus townsendi]XP_048361467.1 uncharacterized protein LOC125437674 [Sphaerodactylus townsendi]XP_048361468.1 uncharacterized protein LOC125437674 [Sphaerodactylus townsendi]XP_048361469.1 uncharacterized prot
MSPEEVPLSKQDLIDFMSQMKELFNAFLKMVQENLKALGEDIQVIKEQSSVTSERITRVERKADQNSVAVTQLNASVAELADRQRGINLRLVGVPKLENETDMMPELIRWMKSLKIDAVPAWFERAHRVFARFGDRPADIVLRCSSEAVKEELFGKLKARGPLAFKGKRIIVRNDISVESLEIKRSLLPFANALYQAGKRFARVLPMGFIYFDRGVKLIARSVEQAKKLLLTVGVPLPEQESQEQPDSSEGEGGSQVGGGGGNESQGSQKSKKA